MGDAAKLNMQEKKGGWEIAKREEAKEDHGKRRNKEGNGPSHLMKKGTT